MHCSLWLKGERCIFPPKFIFVWSWYLMVLAFLEHSYLSVFCLCLYIKLDSYRIPPVCLKLFSSSSYSVFFSHVNKVIVSVHESQQRACTVLARISWVTSAQIPLPCMTFHEFMHVGSTVYILLFVCLSVCQSICQWKRRRAYLSLLCQCLDLNITRVSISLFLSLAWSPPNSLSTVAQPSLYVTQKVLLCFTIHACTHIHTFSHILPSAIH